MTLRRTTIMLDEDLLIKLRTIQAKMIKENNDSISLSRVINAYLAKSLKNKKYF